MKIPPIPLSTRATPITSDNKRNAITITTWVTLVILVLIFLARDAIKYGVARKFGIDDLFILLATIFAVGLSTTTLVIAPDGLGVLGVLTLRRANALMKGTYASNLLYIASIGFAKLSLITFFYGIHIQRTQRRIVFGFGIFILAWTLASLAALAFQCGLPRPWEIWTLHCYNSGVFWIVYCIIDMTTDVSIIMLSVNLVAYLKVKLSRKLAVVACFAPRILVIGASLARLIYLYPITPHDNPAFNLWIPVICTQVHVCLSIVTACIPYMRPFFDVTDSGIWRGDESKRKRATADSLSYGCCSTSYLRGHKKVQGHSLDSSVLASSRNGRTPDVSPRIPCPPPLSPLTPPRLVTPPNSSASNSRSPSERGLRLHIPLPEIHVRRVSDIASPQTANSHALSPECLSPQPLLSPSAFSPTKREPTPPPRSHSPRPGVASSCYGSPDPNLQSPPPRFSLFPQPRPRPRYSLIPQQYEHPPLVPFVPTTISEGSRSGSRPPVHRMSPKVTPETRTPSPNASNPTPSQSAPKYPPRTSSFAKFAYGDPLRIKATAITTTAAVPAPAPLPSAHDAHTSIPSYYVKTPPTAQASEFSSPQTTIPSYYMRTPPTAQAPNFPLLKLPSPYQYDRALPPLPLSPHRQRNQRILTPQNSSRKDQISPVSPVSPPTPLTFWRDESSSDSAGTHRAHEAWEEQNMQAMPVVRDVRSSPHIVVQRYS